LTRMALNRAIEVIEKITRRVGMILGPAIIALAVGALIVGIVLAALRDYGSMPLFVFETVFELIFFGFMPVFLIVATVWIVWHVFETIEPKEVKSIQNFLTYIVVVVPFVMLFYGGAAILIYDQMMAASHGWHLLPLPPSSLMFLAGAVIYIGLSVWLWSHWRKLAIHQ